MDTKIQDNSDLNHTTGSLIPHNDIRNISIFNIYLLQQSVAKFSPKEAKPTRKYTKKPIENFSEKSPQKSVNIENQKVKNNKPIKTRKWESSSKFEYKTNL